MQTATVPMPDYSIKMVSHLRHATRMAPHEFEELRYTIMTYAELYLDNSGLIPVDGQDPAAWKRFLDAVLNRHPTINKTYPYSWPVLAYTEIYLRNRLREFNNRRYGRHHGIKTRNRGMNVHRTARIWQKWAYCIKTGEPFFRTSAQCRIHESEPAPLPKHHKSTKVSSEVAAKERCETRPILRAAEDCEIDQPSDNGPAGTNSGSLTSLWPTLRSFWGDVLSMGTSFGG